METDDGRTLTLNCTLDTEVDQLIYDHYRYELLGDLDGALSLVGDSEALRITTENDVRNVQEGAGVQSYTLHGLHALTADEMARVRAYDRDAILHIVADYGLAEWTLEAVDVEWTYTEAELAKGPQQDARAVYAVFLAGRTSTDQPWRCMNCSGRICCPTPPPRPRTPPAWCWKRCTAATKPRALPLPRR